MYMYMARKKIKFHLKFTVIGIIISLIVTGISTFALNRHEWVQIDDNWYYVNQFDNTKSTGWVKSHGFRYYLNEEGIRQSGWLSFEGHWYYLYNTGEMATGELPVDGHTYYFNNDGIMSTGWVKYNDYYHYFTESGFMLTGWRDIGNAWYYLYSTGEMATGITKFGNDSYFFDDKGVMQVGWIKSTIATRRGKHTDYTDYWYHSDKDGRLQTFWQQIDNNWYYFYSNAEMAHDVTIDGYYFNSSGSWSDNIPANVASNNGNNDANQPEVLYWKTIPVTVTDVSKNMFGSAKITVKTDEYNLTDTFTQFKDKPYADVANSGQLKAGDTIYAELYSWKKGESTITRRQLHLLKYNDN